MYGYILFAFFVKTEIMEKEYISMKHSDFVNDYFKTLKHCRNTREAIDRTCTLPAPRFYCSVEEAHRNCSILFRGGRLKKSAMFAAMYSDMTDIAAGLMDEKGISLRRAIEYMLNTPVQAPSYYMSPYYARAVVGRFLKSKAWKNS